MMFNRTQLIVALDVDTLGEARQLIDILSPRVDIFKVGSQLFTACGPAAVRFILAKRKKVFLDLKYHDIPNTVGRAVETAVGLNLNVHIPLDEKDDKQMNDSRGTGLFMYTVHTSGGFKMMQVAVEAGRKKAKEMGVLEPFAVGVTVLTSEEQGDNIQALVLKRALLAKEAGLDGVVASAQEAPFLRRELGKGFLIVTPGIRLSGIGADDQKRVATPRKAASGGSNFIVVGRPIIEAERPLEVVREILEQIQ